MRGVITLGCVSPSTLHSHIAYKSANPSIQEQHHPGPTGRDCLGRNQPVIHHRPSHNTRLLRNGLVPTALRQVLPRSWPGIRARPFRRLPVPNRRNSPLTSRPRVRPRLWFLPLLHRMPQYHYRAHPGRRGQNDPFRWDVGIRFPGIPTVVYSQETCSDVG